MGWTGLSLTNIPVGSLAVIGTNLYAGTYLTGVFLSTNNGTSWTEVNNGLTNAHVFLVVSGTNLCGNSVGKLSFYLPTMAQAGQRSITV
ncbi:MAG: hypothetical protein MZV64_53020 [Ignavibacteriales bacterium]|nr:hypothetical protein [Ignavibacteriales bacterium]